MTTAYVLSVCFLIGLWITGDALAQRDKGTIVWSSNRNTTAPGGPPGKNHDLWVMEARDGKNRIRVTDLPKNEMEPAWSPDGSQIAFGSNRDGKSDVFIIDVDWDELGRVISSPHKHGWRVAATMNNNVRNLTNDPGNTDESPTWSGNGETIAYVSRRDGNREIYLMRSDGSGQRNLTNHPAEDREPAFSHDGTMIAFRSNRDGSENIFMMNPDGSGVERITDHPGSESQPTWSRSAKKIAFSTNRDGNGEVYTIDIETKKERNITDNPRWGESSPMLPANGRDIIFSAVVGADSFQADLLVIEDFEKCGARCKPTNLLEDMDPWGRGRGTRDIDPDWIDPAFPRSVSPGRQKLTTMWGKIKLMGAGRK